LGERLGEGVMQETVFVLRPLTQPLPQEGERRKIKREQKRKKST
jgi:hypothetical protein